MLAARFNNPFWVFVVEVSALPFLLPPAEGTAAVGSFREKPPEKCGLEKEMLGMSVGLMSISRA